MYDNHILNNAKDTNVNTNITVVEAPTNVDIQSSDGTNDTIAAADETNAGVMTTTMYDNHVLNNAKVTYDDAGAVSTNSAHVADVTGDPHNIEADTLTFTNKTFDANGTGNSISNIDVADLANGTDGELITWSATGVPATVAVGTDTHVLTSNGVGVAPTFQAASGGGITWATPINSDITVDTDSTYDIGTATDCHDNIYCDEMWKSVALP